MSHLTVPLGLYPTAIPCTQAIRHIHIITSNHQGAHQGAEAWGPGYLSVWHG